MKARKDSLFGLTKEERLAKRKASMRAGDSWEDLHGTKDRPKREVSKARAEKLAELAAAHGVAPADVAAAIDWHTAAAPSSDGAGPSSDGAGPSSEDAGDIEQPAAATEARRPSASVGAPPLRERRGSSGTVACRV